MRHLRELEKENTRLKKITTKREVSANLLEAKVLVEEYRSHYNRERPHSALAYLPLAKFATSCELVSVDKDFTKQLESATTLS